MPNFSGKWTLTEQAQGTAAGTWTGLPLYELYAWGDGDDGRLGLNDTINRSSPVQVGGTTWALVSAGSYNNAATKTDGTLWTWGRGGVGQLGLNDTIYRSSPVQVGALTTWSQVSAGTDFAGAVKTDGTLWMWGRGNQGQLGHNNTIDVSSPVQVGALTTWYEVSTGGQHTAAIKTDGTLWAWGEAGEGRLGNNSTVDKSSPIQVGALTNWAQVSASSGSHTAAIKTDGTLWTWGFNTSGQLGQNNTVVTSSPVQVGALTTWAQVSARGNWTAAIKTDGTMWAWGDNGFGRLGTNTPETIDISSPTQIGALTTWAQVSAGGLDGLAIKTDGTLWAWGLNHNGQSGVNDTIARSSPIQVGSLTTWTQVSASSSFASFAINQTTT